MAGQSRPPWVRQKHYCGVDRDRFAQQEIQVSLREPFILPEALLNLSALFLDCGGQDS
jgi:hypothetical protein